VLTEEGHKTITEKTEIARPRYAQLEEKELRKLVFTGDSYYAYDINPEIKTKKLPIDSGTKSKFGAINHQKVNDNARAALETQHVSMPLYNQDEPLGMCGSHQLTKWT
jgi:hypothetical protein